MPRALRPRPEAGPTSHQEGLRAGRPGRGRRVRRAPGEHPGRCRRGPGAAEDATATKPAKKATAKKATAKKATAKKATAKKTTAKKSAKAAPAQEPVEPVDEPVEALVTDEEEVELDADGQPTAAAAPALGVLFQAPDPAAARATPAPRRDQGRRTAPGRPDADRGQR